MAQEVFWNYQAGLNSNEMNRMLLGMFDPGRIRGFDSMLTSASLNFTIEHAGTGVIQTLEDKSLTNAKGVIFTKQGFIIQEDVGIALTCLTNAANAFQRTDLVVCQHEDVNVVGGQAATYLVIRGSNGVTTAPALTNPTYQTIVGTIVIPASESDLDGAEYTPTVCKLVGGHTLEGGNFPELAYYAKKNTAQFWTAYQSFGIGEILAAQTAAGIILCPETGNNFEVNMTHNNVITNIRRASGPTDFAAGTVVNLRIKSTNGVDPMLIRVGPISDIEDWASPETNRTFQLEVGDSISLFRTTVKWVILAMNGEVMRRIESSEADIALINNPANWTAHDAYTGYRLDRQIVHMYGVAGAVGSAMGNAGTDYQLPLAYRPSTDRTIPGVLMMDAGVSSYGTLTIKTTGYVWHSSLTGAGTARHISMTGISFKL